MPKIDYLSLIKSEEIFLWEIPKKYRTYEVCIEAFNKEIMSLIHIPKEYITYKMCLNAIQHNKLLSLASKWYSEPLINAIPEHLQTNELCKLIIQQNPNNFKYIKNPSQEIINLYNILSI
jgi:hypothetical protein